MPKVTRILPTAHGASDTITLDETARHRRRTLLTSDKGVEFLLDLPKARLLRHGEGLQLEGGEIVEIIAKPEKLLCVKGRDQRHLLALAWQIGNRHLAAQILEEHILVRFDPVIKQMLDGLGADTKALEAHFDPEGGAYENGHHHHYD